MADKKPSAKKQIKSINVALNKDRKARGMKRLSNPKPSSSKARKGRMSK